MKIFQVLSKMITPRTCLPIERYCSADGAAFAAITSTNPDLKAFAAETHRIVQRHLGELGVKS
jgi:hypothetical protein